MNTEHAPRRQARKREHHGWVDPFERMHEEFDKLFSENFRRWPIPRLSFGEDSDGALLASLDLSETDDAVEVKVDVPGIDEKDIDIKLSDGALFIKGKRESEEEEKRKNFHRIERSFGAFQRRIALPCDVNEDHVEAKLKKGVLLITLPKSAEAKEHERKIEIDVT